MFLYYKLFWLSTFELANPQLFLVELFSLDKDLLCPMFPFSLLQLLSSHFTINRSSSLRIKHFLKLSRPQIISAPFSFSNIFFKMPASELPTEFQFQWNYFLAPTCLSHVYVAGHYICLYCQNITVGLYLYCGNPKTPLSIAAYPAVQTQPTTLLV